jgi:predicted methyltransferase
MKVKVFSTLSVSHIQDQIEEWFKELEDEGIDIEFVRDPIQVSHNGHVVTTIFYRDK